MAKQETNNFKAMLEATEKDVATLRTIDMDNFKAEVKSNEVTNYVRKSLIIKAFQQSKDLTCGTWYVTGRTLNNIMNAVAMFTNRSTDFKHLLTDVKVEFQAGYGCWKVSYVLNEDAISNSYIHFLNLNYGLDIPEKSSDDRLKEIDNSILTANYNPVDLVAMEG